MRTRLTLPDAIRAGRRKFPVQIARGYYACQRGVVTAVDTLCAAHVGLTGKLSLFPVDYAGTCEYINRKLAEAWPDLFKRIEYQQRIMQALDLRSLPGNKMTFATVLTIFGERGAEAEVCKILDRFDLKDQRKWSQKPSSASR